MDACIKPRLFETRMEFVLCVSIAAGLPAGVASPAPQARLQETLCVALCQMSAADGDVRGNLAKIESQVEQAAARGARFCVVPELADVGFSPIVKASRGAKRAQPIPGETTEALGRMAAASKVRIAIALLEQVPGGGVDTCVLIDDGGRVVLRQGKDFVYPWFGGGKAVKGNYHDAELIDSSTIGHDVSSAMGQMDTEEDLSSDARARSKPSFRSRPVAVEGQRPRPSDPAACARSGCGTSHE